MVRLVFRPYTKLRRSICTLEPLQSSTRVSSGFDLASHSSPSFGSQHVRSTCASPAEAESRRGGGALQINCCYRSPPKFAFILPLGIQFLPAACAHAGLLGPCFKTGQVEASLSTPPFYSKRGPYSQLTNSRRC